MSEVRVVIATGDSHLLCILQVEVFALNSSLECCSPWGRKESDTIHLATEQQQSRYRAGVAPRRKGERACFKGVQGSEFPRRPGLTEARIRGKLFIKKRAGNRTGKGREQMRALAPAEVGKDGLSLMLWGTRSCPKEAGFCTPQGGLSGFRPSAGGRNEFSS